MEVLMTRTEALVRLQQVDLELIRRKRALEALPQGNKIKEIRAAAKKLASELTKIVGIRKDIEMDLAETSEQHNKMAHLVDKVQQDALEGPQDYKAVRELEQQLTHLAKRLEKLEFERNELESKLAKIQTSEKKAREVAERLSQEGHAQATSYQEQSAQITAEIEKLSAEREMLVSELPQELLDTYAKACKRFDGLAVETLTGNRPSICRVTLQPSDFADIRRSNDDICECPYCHRILVTSTAFE